MFLLYRLYLTSSRTSQASIGGDPRGYPGNPVIKPGNQAIRLFGPCLSPTGEGCTVFEDPGLQLITDRWYPASIRIFDGSLLIAGGSHVNSDFFNTDPASSFEFFPRKEETVRPAPRTGHVISHPFCPMYRILHLSEAHHSIMPF